MKKQLTALLLMSVLFLGIPTCILVQEVYAVPAVWYVTAAGAGATDGTSYANAFAGWADINQAGINPGDTLIVCGTITSSGDKAFDRAGTAGNLITITGVCPEEGGQTGILDGNLNATEVLNIGSVSDTSYVVVEHLTIRNSTQNTVADCVLSNGLPGAVGPVVLRYLTISHCGQEGMWMFHPRTTFQYSTVDDIGEDCINVGTYCIDCVIEYNTIGHCSTRVTTGDGIENQTDLAGNLTIRHNRITFDTLSSTKQAIVGGITIGPWVYTIEDNDIIAPVPAVNNGISVVRGTAIVRNNRVSNFSNCIVTFNDTTNPIASIIISGNTMNSCTNAAFRLVATVGSPIYYVYNNTGTNLTNGMSTQIAGTATNAIMYHYNNIYTWKTGVGQVGLNLQTNWAEYHGNNNFYGVRGTNTQFLINTPCGSANVQTVAAYIALCPQEAQSSAADPMLISTTDWRLAPNSPARRAGTPTANCSDNRGRVCFPDRPDVGAYQSGAGDPANPRTPRN